MKKMTLFAATICVCFSISGCATSSSKVTKSVENKIYNEDLKVINANTSELQPVVENLTTSNQPVVVKNVVLSSQAAAPKMSTNKNAKGILIAPFFRNNKDTNVDLYMSSNGINFEKINETPLFNERDSSIIYRNGYFYVLVTSYNPHDFKIKRSKNLKDWEDFNISLGLYSNNGVNDKIWAAEWFEDDNGKLYIILSRKIGKANDINSASIPSFRTYIVEVKNLSSMQFGTPAALNLEDTNKIDGYIYKEKGIYYLFIKDEYDKNTEIWTSSNLINWKKKKDFLYSDKEQVEGVSVVKFNNHYYIYADKFNKGQINVSTSKDLNKFTAWQPLKSSSGTRHGTVLEVKNTEAAKILTNFKISNAKKDIWNSEKLPESKN